MTHTVFVYGSLLSGLGNHGLLVRNNARALGQGSTRAAFTMISLGAFPGVIESGDTAVTGELYEVDDRGLAALDMLESNGRFYTRAEHEIDTDSGSVVAWIYLLPVSYLAERSSRIGDGDWRRFYNAHARDDWRRLWDEAEDDDDDNDGDDPLVECACGGYVSPEDLYYDEGMCDGCAAAFGMLDGLEG